MGKLLTEATIEDEYLKIYDGDIELECLVLLEDKLDIERSEFSKYIKFSKYVKYKTCQYNLRGQISNYRQKNWQELRDFNDDKFQFYVSKIDMNIANSYKSFLK